jgi:predicted RecA/RadA family phage recombinase
MATNFIQDGKKMELPTVTGAESGDAFVVGDFLPCVLLTDAETTSPYNASVQTEGVFELSVVAHDGSSPSAVAVGDALYWTDKNTALDKDTTEDFFGIALEAIASGTETIKVLLVPKTALPDTIGSADIDAGAVLTASITNAQVTSAKLAADTIQIVEKTFTAAQIKTLYSANTNKGLEILAAPGADTMYEFVSATMFYDYDGTNAYTAANGLTFTIDGVAVSDTVGATFLQATADSVAIVQVLSAEVIDASADLFNKALYLQEGTGNPSGSSTATDQLMVRVAYRVHDFS